MRENARAENAKIAAVIGILSFIGAMACSISAVHRAFTEPNEAAPFPASMTALNVLTMAGSLASLPGSRVCAGDRRQGLTSSSLMLATMGPWLLIVTEIASWRHSPSHIADMIKVFGLLAALLSTMGALLNAKLLIDSCRAEADPAAARLLPDAAVPVAAVPAAAPANNHPAVVLTITPRISDDEGRYCKTSMPGAGV